MKGLPAFDDFEMRQPEPSVLGNKTTDAGHGADEDAEGFIAWIGTITGFATRE